MVLRDTSSPARLIELVQSVEVTPADTLAVSAFVDRR